MINLYEIIGTNRDEKNSIISAHIDKILNGEIDPLKVIAALKHIEDVITSIQKSNELINALSQELGKYAKGEKATALNYEISMSSRTNWDYSNCGDVYLDEIKSKAKEKAEEVKAREKFLQTLKTSVFDAENGGFEIKPPQCTYTYYPVLKEKKSVE